MRFVRPCLLLRFLFPDAHFRIRSEEKTLCLTFDDGPDPASTPEILTVLKRYNVKAVFFCTGIAAVKYPQLIDEIKSQGHLIGNHGYDHIDGWKYSCKDYCENVNRASGLTSGKLFRPPYGRFRISQYRCLRKKYKIILWDLMPYDFDQRLSSFQSFDLLTKKMRKGSIIVLHDSDRSNFKSLLGRFIESSFTEGYSFVLPV